MDPERLRAGLERDATIKARLAAKGFSLSDVDRHFSLRRNCAGDTLREPNEAGEKAIAKTLGVHPATLWPERYDAKSRKRLRPQPDANYDRRPPMAQRRKTAA